MDPTFRFEDGEDEEESDAESEEAPEVEPAWDFSSYAASVADEHARRRTTSVDDKISRLLRYSSPHVLPDADATAVQVDGEEEEEEEEEEEQEDDGDEEEEKEQEEDDGGDDEEEVEDNAEKAMIKLDNQQHGTVNKGSVVDSRSFFSSSDGASFAANSFLELNLSRPLLRACEALGYQKPTPIQAACIPLALTGRDICGSAITGSGKTAAFALPVLERLLFRPKRMPAIRVLILTPTRELAAQVHSMIEKVAQFTDIRCCLIVGGLSSKTQESALRSMPDIVVATPGRMIDHLRNSLGIGLEDLAILILDEADRLLELGFSAEIEELIRLCPKRRQTMLFSATMTEEVDVLVKLSMNKPVRLEADPSLKRPATLVEEVVRIRRAREINEEAVLLALCLKTFKEKTIIFSGTKQAAHRLKIIFGLAGLKAAELHGNLTQAERLEALERFRKQEVDFLIATDVAARGLDIYGVQTVINFSCPRDVTTYLHRVGRTARAGREGCAITFVTDDDRSLLKAIAKKAGSQLKSRMVAQKPVDECSKLIDQMEEDISAVLQEEREEMALRRAELQLRKAENMIAHKEEIYSRPRRTWFTTEREKKLLAKAAKNSLTKGGDDPNTVISAQQAEDLRQKEKRRREREKNLPRKKRRRLEALREMEENKKEFDNNIEEDEDEGEDIGEFSRPVKSVKPSKKGTRVKKLQRVQRTGKQPSEKVKSRSEEMHELFQNDMSEWKQARNLKKKNVSSRQKSKSSFKSKSRYKRKK